MPVSRVNFVQGVTWAAIGGGTFASPPQNVTAGNALVACVGGGTTTGQTVTGVTDTAGNTYAKLATVMHATDKYREDVWAATNVAAHAANVVTATWQDALVEYRGMVVMQYSGLAVSPLDDTEQKIDAPFDIPSLTGTTPDSVHILMSRWGFGSTVFPAGFTEFTTAGAGVPEVADKIVTGGAFTGSYSLSSCNFFALAVILKGATAATGGLEPWQRVYVAGTTEPHARRVLMGGSVPGIEPWQRVEPVADVTKVEAWQRIATIVPGEPWQRRLQP